METDASRVTYRSADAVLVRVPLAAMESGDAAADSYASTPPTTDQLRARIRDLRTSSLLMSAVTLASPSVRHTSAQPLDQLPAKRLRTLAASLTAYSARIRARATPFGLFAGVALAHRADRSRGDLGAVDSHRLVCRPDAAWFRGVVQVLERSEHGIQRLHFTANPMILRSAEYLELPAPDERTRRVRLRATASLHALLATATTPVPGSRLLRLAEEGGRGAEQAGRLVRQLIAYGFLVSELHPPPHSCDPLGHVLTHLRQHAWPPAVTSGFEQFEDAVHDFAAGPLTDAEAGLDRVQAAAREISRRIVAPEPGGAALHVDTLLRAEVAIGALVRREAEDAAAVLARFADTRERQDLQRHLERVAGGYTVPVNDAIGSRAETKARRVPPALLKAYLTALRERRSEIVLDDELLDAIAPADPHTDPIPEMDLYTVITAADPRALDRGDFRLHLRRPATTSSGTALARFAFALGIAGEEALRDTNERADRSASRVAGMAVIPADLTFLPRHAAAENVSRVPLIRSARICTNRDAGAAFGLSDLLLYPGPRGPEVWSRSLGSRVLPRATTAVDTEVTAPPGAHLLAVASNQNVAVGFRWGDLAEAPWLPRVIRGRTVYSPQTWRPGPDLTGDPARDPNWYQRFSAWCREWSVPTRVILVDGDRQMPLRLSDPVDLSVIQRQAQKGPVILAESWSAQDCWMRSPAGRHLMEAVFAMALASPPCRPDVTRRRGVPPERPVPPPVVPPGGEWLRILLACPASRRRLLPQRLVTELASHRWFYTWRDDGRLDLGVRLDGDLDGDSVRWADLADRIGSMWSAMYSGDAPADGLAIVPYHRDAGAGLPIPRPDLFEEWAFHDTACALAAADTDIDHAPLFSVVDLARRLAMATGRLPLHDIEPDRRAFAPLRRSVLPLITETVEWNRLMNDEQGRDLVTRWHDRAVAAMVHLRSAGVAVDLSSQLMLRQHALRLTGNPDDAEALLRLAAGAEFAVRSWRHGTGGIRDAR